MSFDELASWHPPAPTRSEVTGRHLATPGDASTRFAAAAVPGA
jgi:hypothetical protein